MSLGTFNNGVNKKKDYSPVTYSPVRFANPDSKIDPSGLSFSFWKSLLKISIAPYTSNANGSFPTIDKDNSIDIYLSPMKAKILLDNCIAFQNDIHRWDNIGVNTNKGLIYLTDGREEFGVDDGSIFLVIKLIDSESGEITSAIAYQFVNNYYAITNYKGGSNFAKEVSTSNPELEMFIQVLKSYVENVNAAIAASIIDSQKYDMNRITTRINSIQEKLGIQTSSNNGGKGFAKSFFDNNSGSDTTSSSSKEDYSYGDLLGDLSDMSFD